MDYRDPLFSVIVFFIIVLITIILTLFFGKIKALLKQKHIEKLLKDFDYIDIEKLNSNSYEALVLLAKAYEIKGDYEKALKIYILLEKEKSNIEVLRNIAKLYFKAGFLEKSKNILYQILKVRPRDIDSLKLLIIVDEKLNNYKEIIDILDVFDALEIDLKKEKANALINLLKNKCCNIEEFCKGFNSIEDVYRVYPFIKREYIEYLFKINPKKAYEVLDVYEHLDLYFYRNDIPKNEKFCNILAAKKVLNCSNKAIFEIEVLKYLPKDLAILKFEYICNSCKKVYPFYSTRCPSCNELFEMKVLIKLEENKSIENIEF